MNIKDSFYKLKKKFANNNDYESMEDISIPICLDDKVDSFINWYRSNMISGDDVSNVAKYNDPKKLRNLIEKMAVWYELRYPDYDLESILHFGEKTDSSINDIMFRDNPYVRNLFDEKTDVRDIDWADFYNIDAFMKSLPSDERKFFVKPRYNDLVYLDPSLRANHLTMRNAHLHLTRKGNVDMAEEVGIYTHGVVKDEELVGLNIRTVVELFKERGVKLPKNNELDQTLRHVDMINMLHDGIFDCAMYRVLERGGKTYGPYRAFLFAKEFGRDIDIPMMYAVDNFYDPKLRLFINEYLKAGGDKDLKCYIGYFSKASKREMLDTASVQDVLFTQTHYDPSFYTPEEQELHQRLVSVISGKVNYQELKKAKAEEEKKMVKELRIQRKLAKSKLR